MMRGIFSKISKSHIFNYAALVILAMLAAFNYEIFVHPNSFAPSGVNGIATMIQYLLNFSVGYMSLLINIPMLIVAAIRFAATGFLK